jgi:hypothetical protein
MEDSTCMDTLPSIRNTGDNRKNIVISRSLRIGLKVIYRLEDRVSTVGGFVRLKNPGIQWSDIRRGCGDAASCLRPKLSGICTKAHSASKLS